MRSLINVLFITSHHRHELGSAAALLNQGINVNYIAIGSMPSCKLEKNDGALTVKHKEKNYNIAINYVSNASDLSNLKNLKKFIRDLPIENIDLISTTNETWWIGHRIAHILDIPLINKIWGYKFLKIQIFIKYFDYYNVLLSFPSFFNAFFEINLSENNIFYDNYNYQIFNNGLLGLLNEKPSNIIYPTYAVIQNKTKSQEKFIEYINCFDRYVFCIASASYSNAQYTEKFLLKICLKIAIKLPDINIIVVGTTENDFLKLFRMNKIPKNLILLGKIYDDNSLENLYINATLVLSPVLYGSTISNRLLEALYYNSVILTNSIASDLFPELLNEKSAFISDDYDNYGNLINKIIDNIDIITEIQKNCKKTYKEHFSIEIHGNELKKIIENLATEYDNY